MKSKLLFIFLFCLTFLFGCNGGSNNSLKSASNFWGSATSTEIETKNQYNLVRTDANGNSHKICEVESLQVNDVVYNYNPTESVTFKVPNNEKIESYSPTKYNDGRVITGWKTENSETAYTDTVTGDISLYPIWEAATNINDKVVSNVVNVENEIAFIDFTNLSTDTLTINVKENNKFLYIKGDLSKSYHCFIEIFARTSNLRICLEDLNIYGNYDVIRATAVNANVIIEAKGKCTIKSKNSYTVGGKNYTFLGHNGELEISGADGGTGAGGSCAITCESLNINNTTLKVKGGNGGVGANGANRTTNGNGNPGEKGGNGAVAAYAEKAFSIVDAKLVFNGGNGGKGGNGSAGKALLGVLDYPGGDGGNGGNGDSALGFGPIKMYAYLENENIFSGCVAGLGGLGGEPGANSGSFTPQDPGKHGANGQKGATFKIESETVRV